MLSVVGWKDFPGDPPCHRLRSGRSRKDLCPRGRAKGHQRAGHVAICCRLARVRAAIKTRRHRRHGAVLAHASGHGGHERPSQKARDGKDRQQMAEQGQDFHALIVACFYALEKVLACGGLTSGRPTGPLLPLAIWTRADGACDAFGAGGRSSRFVPPLQAFVSASDSPRTGSRLRVRFP